jgi:hypothetical protein
MACDVGAATVAVASRPRHKTEGRHDPGDIRVRGPLGEVIDRPNEGYVEIRWFDSTEGMSRSDFETWLRIFAEQVEQIRRPGILVDATRFLLDPAHMSAEWRDAQIVPRYNAAVYASSLSTCLTRCP